MDFDDMRMLRISDVMRLLGVSKSTIYYWISIGYFLPGLKVGPGVRAWPAGEVRKWLDDRPSASPNVR